MLKDSLYGYGLISKILNIVIILLIFLMYAGAFYHDYFYNLYGIDIYQASLFLLFFLLIIKSIWYFCNDHPICFTPNLVSCIIFRVSLFIIYLVLFIIVINEFFLFFINSYMAYLDNFNNQTPYTFLHITIIPFSVIRLIICLLEFNLHVNIFSFKDTLFYYNSILFKLVLPFFIFFFILQLILYNKKKKYI